MSTPIRWPAACQRCSSGSANSSSVIPITMAITPEAAGLLNVAVQTRHFAREAQAVTTAH